MIKRLVIIFILLSLAGILSISIPNKEMDFSKVLLASDGSLISAQIAKDQQWRFPIDEALPEAFKNAVLHFEDEYFYYHPGVNPISICKAFYANSKSKSIKRGGSTITMQLMRMYRGNRKRTYGQKMIEILGAFKLELLYSKEEILYLWASVAPFGGNTVGASTASYRYFNRDLSELSMAEYATLAVLPNTPAKIHMAKNRVRLKQKRDALLNKLFLNGKIDSLDLVLSLDEDIPTYLNKIPQNGFHFLDYLVKNNLDKNIFHSTISIRYQEVFENILQTESEIYQHDGIENAAGIIIDIEKNELLAYVGNTKVKSEFRFVDCVQAPRSYGSLLKPFLYAQAIDQGYFLPYELIKDIPTNYDGFIPKNFDKRFRGVVPMDEMVSKSLNVPAVRILNYVGLNTFHDLMVNDLGLSYIHQNPDYHGLSIILGGAESTMWDIANAYKGLVRNHQGKVQPFGQLKTLKNEIVIDKDFSFNPISASHTIEAMCSVNRPKEEQHFVKMNGQKIAWKTGTSYGHRDAWSIGANGKYLVAVWVGNETGEGVYDLTGGKKAAPILFKTLRSLGEGESLNTAAHDSKLVTMCKESGMQKGKWCSNFDYIEVGSISHQLRNCDKHEVVSESEKIDTLFLLSPTEDYYYHKFNETNNEMELSNDLMASSNLKIVYPEKDAIIVLPKKLDQDYAELKLEASSLNSHTKLFWFVDSKFIASTMAPHHISASFVEGSHDVMVNDQYGQTQEISFDIIRR